MIPSGVSGHAETLERRIPMPRRTPAVCVCVCVVPIVLAQPVFQRCCEQPGKCALQILPVTFWKDGHLASLPNRHGISHPPELSSSSPVFRCSHLALLCLDV